MVADNGISEDAANQGLADVIAILNTCRLQMGIEDAYRVVAYEYIGPHILVVSVIIKMLACTEDGVSVQYRKVEYFILPAVLGRVGVIWKCRLDVIP